MRYRLIGSKRLIKEGSYLPPIELDGSKTTPQFLKEKNDKGYHIFYFPNSTSSTDVKYMEAKDVDKFDWVFVDMDLKDGVYSSISDFIKKVKEFPVGPTKVLKSGHGIHVYWKISDLDMYSYCELSRALIQHFKTDPSIWTILQLMRVPNYLNTKYEEQVMCEEIIDPELSKNGTYSVEEMWQHLEPISIGIRKEIQAHINEHVYGIKPEPKQLLLGDIPKRFEKLLESNASINELFYNPGSDRSLADMRIANVLYLDKFSREEAVEIVAQTLKGQERGYKYAKSLVDKVYDNPPTVLDDAYSEAHSILLNEFTLQKMEQENRQFDIESKNRKVKEAKQAEYLKDNYTLHGYEESLVDYYKKEIEAEIFEMRDRLPFITPNLSRVVPLYGIQNILIAGKSGGSKSTTMCNIIYPVLKEEHAVAVISTEEKGRNIALRLACLDKGVNYNNRANWSSEVSRSTIDSIGPFLSKHNLKIYDQYTRGRDVNTGEEVDALDMTSIEGLELALQDIERWETKPKVVLLDYITKIDNSKTQRGADSWRIIVKAAKLMEEWSKKMTIPAIIFTQLEEESATRNTFKNRLPGAKAIYNLATCIIELNTNYEEKTTQFICHKNRDEGTLFRKTLRYEDGRFIDNLADDDSIEEYVDG